MSSEFDDFLYGEIDDENIRDPDGDTISVHKGKTHKEIRKPPTTPEEVIERLMQDIVSEKTDKEEDPVSYKEQFRELLSQERKQYQ